MEKRLDNINRSLVQSREIAAGIEDASQNRAKSILAEAEAVVVSRQAQVKLIEQEMTVLEKEWEYCNRLVREEQIPASRSEAVKPYEITRPLTVPAQVVAEDNAMYSIKLVSFINARHFVTFGNTTGPVHAHSWQIELEVSVPAENSETIEFATISMAISQTLMPFENVVLNYTNPFNLIQPTSENIAMYFFNLIENALKGMELGLARLTLWETPTRGIQVANRNPDFDNIIINEGLREVELAEKQAAIALEPETDDLIDELRATITEPPLKLPQLQGALYPPYSFHLYAIGFIIITAVAILAYHNILWTPAERYFPWGTDTWGHLFKAEYLFNEILKGNYYPQFTEYWYNGNQPFRYWAPLPYYFLVLLRVFTGNIFVAGNIYVFLCALLGGLSWLLLSRRIGLWPAVMAGAIWVIWLDNVRVACSEGDLPRVLATALLPLLFVLFVNLMERRKSFLVIICTVVLIHMIILCHAMIGAVYCICLVAFSFFLWSFGGCRLKDCLIGAVVLSIGVLSSSWWLLPSLTGGITEIDVEAVKSTVQFIAAKVSFNPFYRLTNRETFYWGISLLAALAATFITWRSKPPWAKSLAICGVLIILISFPLMRPFYLMLPLTHLIWPIRFRSFGVMAILGASLAFNLPEERQVWLKSSLTSLIIVGLGIILVIDCWISLPLLAYTGPKSFNLVQSSDFIKQNSGWRVATIDLSQLGSPPSYTFSELAGREQVFGWAWQGAVTSNNIMLINTGVETQYYPFLLRSCVDLGATDLIIKESIIKKPQVFYQAATRAGYKHVETFGEIGIWHSIDKPYLIEKKPQCLVIGKFAGTVGLQFPKVEMGLYNHLDKYSLEDLKKYSTVILSGATWNSKNRAEQVVRDYIASGGKVYVELAGMPENVLAKQPEFLGVYGEAVNLRGGIEIRGNNKTFQLRPFSRDMPIWNTYVPMGLDKAELEFSYYGNQAPVFGYKLVDGKKVWFLGGNLMYHTFITGDPVAIKMLEDILGLSTDYSREKLIPLSNYQASEHGYRMTYSSDHNLNAVVPIAAINGIKVKVDNRLYPVSTFENLLQLNLPAGTHRIEISLVKTPVYKWGAAISILAVILLLAGIIYIRRTGEDLK